MHQMISKKEAVSIHRTSLLKGILYGIATIICAVAFMHCLNIKEGFLAAICLLLSLWTGMGFLVNWFLHMIACESLEAYGNAPIQDEEIPQEVKKEEDQPKENKNV
jgi:hypothetical protein